MIRGVGDWDSVTGRVLLVVNSAADAPGEASAVVERLSPRADVHVVAPLSWRAWCESQRWPADRVLFAADAQGRDIELNYFLEQLDTLHWILQRQPAFIVGSSPHNLYNEEIKEPFERRVALSLGSGRLLTHALPAPYVYFLALGDVLQRLDRTRRVAEYKAVTRALVDDLCSEWNASGRPRPLDESAPPPEALARHLGGLMPFDEATTHLGNGLVSVETLAEFLEYMENLFHPAIGLRDRHVRDLDETVERQRVAIETRDRMLADLRDEMGRELTRRDTINAGIVEERNAAVARRDTINAELAEERRAAVSERDAIIERLRAELDRVTAGWRRFVVGRPRV